MCHKNLVVTLEKLLAMKLDNRCADSRINSVLVECHFSSQIVSSPSTRLLFATAGKNSLYRETYMKIFRLARINIGASEDYGGRIFRAIQSDYLR